MGGEHGNRTRPSGHSHGLTPAWAGNTSPTVRRLAQPVRGLTPAWAGNTRSPSASSRASSKGSPPRGRGTPGSSAWAAITRDRAHPRVGGEHHHSQCRPPAGAGGSPPRGRGTLAPHNLGFCGNGLTPAWAGNTWPPLRHGETTPGSPPRGRGTLLDTRGRPIRNSAGLTPAWAGNTSSDRHRDPHVRLLGSPPRGRGTLLAAEPVHGRRRLTPAWAGNTAPPPTRSASRTAHPRVGGEHSGRTHARPWLMLSGSPPRGRGTPGTRRHCRRGTGRAHPRVGGEHSPGRCSTTGSR